MNLEMYQKLREGIPNFDDDYCQWVPISSVVFDRTSSQVRQGGHAVHKVAAMAEHFGVVGQKVPVTVRKMDNGQFELKDGCTRTLSAERANKELWISIYHDSIIKTELEWRLHQIKSNDHQQQTPNSDADAKAFIQQEFLDGSMSKRLGFEYDKDPEKFLDDAAILYRKAYSNLGNPKSWFKARVKDSLKGHLASMYENYTKPQAFEFAKKELNLSNSKIGDVSNNTVVYVHNSLANRSPVANGGIATKREKEKNSDLHAKIIWYVADTAGKTETAILEERQKICDWFDEQVYHDWYRCTSVELFFMPQFKQGINPENLNYLIPGKKFTRP